MSRPDLAEGVKQRVVAFGFKPDQLRVIATPNGLFNHTAAIYQMMTGYTTDKVSPSGQLEPPSPKDFPNFGSQLVRLRPPTEPMLPFVMLPRPLNYSPSGSRNGIFMPIILRYLADMRIAKTVSTVRRRILGIPA